MTALPSPHRRTLLLAPLAAATACGTSVTEDAAERPTGNAAPDSSGGSGASGVPGGGGGAVLRTQPGIATAQAAHVLLLAHDLSPARPGPAAARRVLSDWWTDWTTRPSPGLTPTVAIGPFLHRKLGLTAPPRLKDLPTFPHDRLAPRHGGGARMLRRGYTYDNGLLFLAHLRDPALFTRVQERLATTDALTPFIEHHASVIAHVLPPPPPGTPLGNQLH